jgi:hypothetical protein
VIQRLADGAVQADLARTYGVSQATISRLSAPGPFDGRGRLLGRERPERSDCHDDFDVEANQLCCEFGQPFGPILRIAAFDDKVCSFDPSQLRQGASKKAGRTEGDLEAGLSKPMVCVFPVCCARAANGHAAAAPPRSVMNARRFIRSPRLRWRAAHPAR